ncbi:hypothetical protein Tco_1221476 [Tanacetum coccineum]
MHNNIMAAGFKRPASYAWTQKKFSWKCIFEVHFRPTHVTALQQLSSREHSTSTAHEEAEQYTIRQQEQTFTFKLKKVSNFSLILTGIGDEIYSTVDACNTSKEMWTAIERLQQGESLNVQDASPVGNKRDTVRNCKVFGHYAGNAKPKRVKDYAYHKEKMMMCKQAEQGVPLQAEQADWLEDTDEEIDEQELEAHYSYMAKISRILYLNIQFYWSAIRTGTKP